MMNLKNEKWKRVKLDFEYTNDVRIEISNFGRVRTFTKIEDGRILKPVLINGYPIVRFKLFKARDKQMEKRIAFFKTQMSKLRKNVVPERQSVTQRKTRDADYFAKRKKVKEADELLEVLYEHYRKEFDADVRARTIYYAPLVHRLVAEYFVKRESENHSVVAHLDYAKQNNYFTNIKWMTKEENTLHQRNSPHVLAEKEIRKSGKKKRAASSKAFKLDRIKVAIIKKRIKEGKNEKDLAKRFGVTEMQINRIKRGENWGNVRAAV